MKYFIFSALLLLAFACRNTQIESEMPTETVANFALPTPDSLAFDDTKLGSFTSVGGWNYVGYASATINGKPWSGGGIEKYPDRPDNDNYYLGLLRFDSVTNYLIGELFIENIKRYNGIYFMKDNLNLYYGEYISERCSPKSLYYKDPKDSLFNFVKVIDYKPETKEFKARFRCKLYLDEDFNMLEDSTTPKILIFDDGILHGNIE